MNLGINIKKSRTDKSMSQKELSNKVGVTQAMINQIEKGVKITVCVPTGDLTLDEIKISDEELD